MVGYSHHVNARASMHDDNERNVMSAVFLDRDGVLNVYLPGDYVKTPEELLLLPGVGTVIARLNALGYPVFIISNQQGVAKGLMTHDDLRSVDAALCDRLREFGATIVQSYYCTDSASANSEFRKPRPGMILQAAREHSLDLANACFIGDTETDAEAARAAGVGCFILVLTGKFTDAAIAENRNVFPVPPDYVATDLADAVDWFLNRAENHQEQTTNI